MADSARSSVVGSFLKESVLNTAMGLTCEGKWLTLGHLDFFAVPILSISFRARWAKTKLVKEVMKAVGTLSF